MRKIIVFITLLFISSLSAQAATQSGKVVTVPHHKSTHVTLAGKAKRVSLGDPDVLDIVMLKSDEVFLIGKKLGSTNLMAWDSRGRLIESINIEVTHDLNSLKAKLYEFLPNESIEVHSAQNRLILSGQVSHQSAMNIALRVAETYSAGQEADKEDKSLSEQGQRTGVINLMTIGGAQQVMLEVTVAEVQRSLVRKTLWIALNSYKIYSQTRSTVAIWYFRRLVHVANVFCAHLYLRTSSRSNVRRGDDC